MLVCSKREVKRVADLTDDETVDLWLIAKKLGRQLESYHKASSLTFCIQVRQLKETLTMCFFISANFYSLILLIKYNCLRLTCYHATTIF